MLARYPFVSQALALAVLRVTTAGLFMAHAVGRIVLGTIPQFGGFLEARGFPQGQAIVWAITVAEIVCGGLLILNLRARWATIPLLLIAVGGIVLIHARLGWFVGEHGTGGMEYSVALIVALLVIAAADREARPPASVTTSA